MDIFRYRPGNTHPIKSARPPAYLIQDNQTSGSGVIQNVGRLNHLNHEGALTLSQVVECTHPGEYPIYESNSSLAGRDETANLGHEDNQSHLPEIGRFTGHIGACDNYQLVFVTIQPHIVRDKSLTQIHIFDHRMSAINNDNFIAFVDHGHHIVRTIRDLGQGD